MEHPFFKPWIGKDYYKGYLKRRILVLGESHYCALPNDAVPDLTINIIKDLLDPDSPSEPYKNTYRKFEHALAGHRLENAERVQLWNKIAFYNYVQYPLLGPRKAPERTEFKDSVEPFFEVLGDLSPDVVIVWGQRLYNNLPQFGSQIPDLVLPDGSEIECWSYTSNYGIIAHLLPIQHPSTGFSPNYWHTAIAQMINMVEPTHLCMQ